MIKSKIQPGKIGIVTVTYNSGAVLQDFLDSIAAQTYKNFVLYVVDNVSKDNSVQMVRARTDVPVVIHLNSENVGVAEGNNHGMRAALVDGCECILLINNDTVFPPNLIAELYAGMERHDCDMTTGKMYFHGQPNVIWCAGGHFIDWLGYVVIHDGDRKVDVGQHDVARRITYTPTCCLLLRSSVIDRVGMMDAKYFAYYDDADFLLRCMSKGISLWYLPSVKLWHKVSSLTSTGSDFSIRLFARNRMYYLRKHAPGFRAYAWYFLEQSQYALAFLLFRSSLAKWRLRRKAGHEGWMMPIDSN